MVSDMDFVLTILIPLDQEGQHPWNLLDVHGKSAADYARDTGHEGVWDLIVDQGVRAEQLFMALRKFQGKTEPEVNEEENTSDVYLHQSLHYSADGTQLLDADSNAVMMGWETPLMKVSAEKLLEAWNLNHSGAPGRVVNVGFGLGIFDAFIQQAHPQEHHVIEAHPDVLAYIRSNQSTRLDTSKLIIQNGKWQQVLPRLIAAGMKFDIVYFDTYAESYDDLSEFHQLVMQCLAPGGCYSWFHGGGAGSETSLFNVVYKEIATKELEACGMKVSWHCIPLEPLGDETWQGIRRPYFTLDHYWLPICVKQ
jgi:protein arginine N-methyltransferase 2